ncbi:hypothetical protein AVEN_139197-1 [Araneus ventricosus]|uniref:Uncharacterized protein n=1 Tax=Araneus ventricosus TaxID=182803 RepID=A0A4Y2PRA1_ARAVE|nr:hypothetical protein AVEN_139197-1 [Araneus ventricosus]
MTVSMCVGILYHNLNKSITKLSVVRRYIIQRNNDPKHTSNIISRKPRLRYWSGHHKALTLIPSRIYGQFCIRNCLFEERRSKNQFFERIKDEWSSINQEAAKKLVDNLNQRLKAVIVAKEGPDKD